MQRVASGQRVKDLNSAQSMASVLGSGESAAGSCPQTALPTGRNVPSNLSSVIGGSHPAADVDNTVYGVLVRREPVSCRISAQIRARS